MRVFKPLYLVPQGLHLGRAIGADLLQAGRGVALHPFGKNLHLQLFRPEVGKRLFLPDILGVEDGKRLGIIHLFPGQHDIIGQRLAVFPAVEAVQLLKARRGDLFRRFAQLDLGFQFAFGIFDGDQLIHAAENRLVFAGNKVFADAEGIQRCTLQQQIPNNIFIQRIRGHDLDIGKSGIIQHLAGFFGKIGQIAAVQPDALGAEPAGKYDLIKNTDRIGDTGFEYIIGIHQQTAVIGIGFRIGLERLVFAFEGLHPAVGHGAGGGNTHHAVADGAGGSGAARNVGGAGAQHGAVIALGAAGAEFNNGTALRRANQAAGFGRDQRFKIEGDQQHGFHHLHLLQRPADGDDRLVGKNGRPFPDAPDIAAELKVPQKVKEFFRKAALAAEIIDILLGKG